MIQRVHSIGLSKDKSNYIKGMATVLVLIAHYSQYYVSQTNGGIVWWLLTKTGRYGVSLFFAISGYGLVLSAERKLDSTFLKRRLANVYLPYILISGGIGVLQSSLKTSLAVIKLLFCLNAWFIFVIMLFYLLFYCVWKYGRKNIGMLILGVFLISVLLAILFRDEVWYASNISFIIGVIIGRYRSEIFNYCFEHRWIIAFNSVGFVISAIIYTGCSNLNMAFFLLFKVLASALWSTLVLLIMALIKIPDSRILKQIGMCSLECYLTHTFVLDIVSKTIKNNYLFIIIFCMLLTVSFSLILNFLWGKIKIFVFKNNGI